MPNIFDNLKKKAYSLAGIMTIASMMSTACSDANSEKNPTSTYTPTVKITETVPPTDTDTPVPPTATLEEIASPTLEPTEEGSNIIKKLEEDVSVIRSFREQNDSDYIYRINPELAEEYVANILFCGKKEGSGPPDTYFILSLKEDMGIPVTEEPRDMYTAESGRRLNSYLGYPDGPIDGLWYNTMVQSSLIPMVENSTGIPIDYFVVLSSENLIVDMAEIFGGLDVKMDNDSYDDRHKILYEEGKEYPLSGEKLRYFIMMRKSDGADQRMDRQVLIGKTIFRTLLGDIKSKPVNGISEMLDIYKLINQYQKDGKLIFNTSTPEVDRDFKGMYFNMAIPLLKDAIAGKINMPDFEKTVNIGSLGLYQPWGDDPTHGMREYRSAIDEKFFVDTFVITEFKPNGRTVVRESRDMNYLVDSLFMCHGGIIYSKATEQEDEYFYCETKNVESVLRYVRNVYWADLREKVADALLEN